MEEQHTEGSCGEEELCEKTPRMRCVATRGGGARAAVVSVEHRSTPRAGQKHEKSHGGCTRQLRVTYRYGTSDGLNQ